MSGGAPSHGDDPGTPPKANTPPHTKIRCHPRLQNLRFWRRRRESWERPWSLAEQDAALRLLEGVPGAYGAHTPAEYVTAVGRWPGRPVLRLWPGAYDRG